MRQIKIDIDTNEGQNVFNLPKVKGKLSSIIVTSMEKIALIVRSELDYLILNVHEHEGVKYYAPRAVMQGPSRSLFVNDQFDNFLLNEKLDLIVAGPPNQTVNIILRLED